MELLNTPLKNTYIVKGKDALVFKKDSNWIFIEYYENEQKMKNLNIKF